MMPVDNNKRNTVTKVPVDYDPSVPPPGVESIPMTTFTETSGPNSDPIIHPKPSTSKQSNVDDSENRLPKTDILGNKQPHIKNDAHAISTVKDGYFNEFAGKSTSPGQLPIRKAPNINPYIKHPAALAAQGASSYMDSYNAHNMTNIRGDYNVFMGEYHAGKYGAYSGMDRHTDLMNAEIQRKIEHHNTFYDFMGNTFGLAGKLVGSLSSRSDDFTNFSKVDFKTARDQTGTAVDPSKGLLSTFSRDIHQPLKDNTVSESQV